MYCSGMQLFLFQSNFQPVFFLLEISWKNPQSPGKNGSFRCIATLLLRCQETGTKVLWNNQNSSAYEGGWGGGGGYAPQIQEQKSQKMSSFFVVVSEPIMHAWLLYLMSWSLCTDICFAFGIHEIPEACDPQGSLSELETEKWSTLYWFDSVTCFTALSGVTGWLSG